MTTVNIVNIIANITVNINITGIANIAVCIIVFFPGVRLDYLNIFPVLKWLTCFIHLKKGLRTWKNNCVVDYGIFVRATC